MSDNFDRTNHESTIRRKSRASAAIDFAALAGETYSFDSQEDDPRLDEYQYANKHILQVISRTFHDSDDCIQTLLDGSQLTTEHLRNPNHPLTLHRPIWIKDTPESIGMKVPSSDSTFREIAEKIGMRHPISVMDVKHQDELDGWVLEDMVLYFEDDARTYHCSNTGKRKKRSTMRVLNQISLEFSLTPFRKEVLSPNFVREMDFIDKIWPKKLKLDGYYPRVQYYFLTSTGGCYTDFHVDFGGTSVWYHVISGRKVFLLIPPTDTNMKLYEDWLCRKDQNDLFFPDYFKDGDQVDSCFKVTLEQGNSFIIPSGWIHAVYTPVDSLVIGGNFLHGLAISSQINVNCIESRTRVPQKFRFPFFKQIMLYAAKDYFKNIYNSSEDVIKSFLVKEELLALPNLVTAARGWVEPKGDNVDQIASMVYVETDCIQDLSYLGVVDMEDMLNRMDCEVERLLKSNIFPWTQSKNDVCSSEEEYKVTKVFSMKEMQCSPSICDEANCNLVSFCTWAPTSGTDKSYNYCLDCTWKYFGGSKVGASEFPDKFDCDHRDFIRSVSTAYPKRVNIFRVKGGDTNSVGTILTPQPKLKIRIKAKIIGHSSESPISSNSIPLNSYVEPLLSASEAVLEKKVIEDDEDLPEVSISMHTSHNNSSYSKKDLISRNHSDDMDEWFPSDANETDHHFGTIMKRAKYSQDHKLKLANKKVSTAVKTQCSAKARLKKKLGF